MIWVNLELIKNFTDTFGLNIVDKFTKISKIGFSLECFTAEFPSTTLNLPLRVQLGTLLRF